MRKLRHLKISVYESIRETLAFRWRGRLEKEYILLLFRVVLSLNTWRRKALMEKKMTL